ncbi:MAG: hypothetical protein ACLQVI_38455 [Polyangiaceae bacterium]
MKIRSRLLVAPFALATLLACAPEAPTPGPEARCADTCVAKAHACTAAQCARGCRIVLDRLVEHEGASVLACVARAKAPHACDDMTFADCAARSGPYANGGPAPPRPPSDDDQP